ncbi:MAG TPA: hypothetical protein VG122_04875 [Gemmata sp.]|jgi:hypothetical protein|nr:hypothetical protein [Gemmata sp.]
MPHEVILNALPAGISTNAARAGEKVRVQSSGFLSSEDGQNLIAQLEQFPTGLLLKAVGDRISPSQVETMLAVIRRDMTATIYVNELRPVLTTKIGRSINRGDPVLKDDIIDITRVKLGVDVPNDAAILFVFSWGWRKGLFFDFNPVTPKAESREYDLEEYLGALYARLVFQERFHITDEEWAKMFEAGWFPFVGLNNETIKSMLAQIRAGWKLDELTPRVVEELRSKMPSFLESWKLRPELLSHFHTLETAVGDFLSGDFVGCSKELFPTIEEIWKSVPTKADAEQTDSLLMPHLFKKYLQEVYLISSKAEASHVEGEGADVDQRLLSFEAKSATVALLVLNQIIHIHIPTLQNIGLEPTKSGADSKPRKLRIDPVDAVNRWYRWSARGPENKLTQMIERLDGKLPEGWKRLQGEELDPYKSIRRNEVAWYSIATTDRFIGVTLSISQPTAEVMRGGMVRFADPPSPPTATTAASWEQVVQFLDEGVAIAAYSSGLEISAPSSEDLFLTELPEDIGKALCIFSRSASKSIPLELDDSKRWISFVIATFRAKTVIDSRRLIQWLIQEEWDEDAARELSKQFIDNCRLLGRYAEEVTSA